MENLTKKEKKRLSALISLKANEYYNGYNFKDFEILKSIAEKLDLECKEDLNLE